METVSKITQTQRDLLELLAANPRYRTKTEEGTKDLMSLAMMGMVHDVYEMIGGGYIGTISKAGRDALAAS